MTCNVFSFIFIITNEAALPRVSYYWREQSSAFVQLGQEVKGHRFVFFFTVLAMTRGLTILVLWPGIEPVPPALERAES